VKSPGARGRHQERRLFPKEMSNNWGLAEKAQEKERLSGEPDRVVFARKEKVEKKSTLEHR